MFWIISAPIMALAFAVATVPLIVTTVVDGRRERHDADVVKSLADVPCHSDTSGGIGASGRARRREATTIATPPLPAPRPRTMVAAYYLGRPSDVWIRALQPAGRPTQLTVATAPSLERAA